MTLKPRIIFMGTPQYAVPFLEALIAADLSPIAVITQPDKPVGRSKTPQGSPIKVCAQTHTIPVLQPASVNTDEFYEQLTPLAPTCIVVVAFGQIISRRILALPVRGCINVHPSLLPRHRGATPLQEAILSGDTQTGVTIMLMDEKMDHGPILSQETISLSADETYESLSKKTITLGQKLLIQTLAKWLNEKIAPQVQDESVATYTRLLHRDTGKIDWKQSSEYIFRQWRALHPWPGIWTEWHDKRIKLLEVTPYANSLSLEKNNLFVEHEGTLLARCAESFLEIKKLQVEGKSPLSASEFIQGYLGK